MRFIKCASKFWIKVCESQNLVDLEFWYVLEGLKV